MAFDHHFILQPFVQIAPVQEAGGDQVMVSF
jgi:hypothetical protein